MLSGTSLIASLTAWTRVAEFQFVSFTYARACSFTDTNTPGILARQWLAACNDHLEIDAAADKSMLAVGLHRIMNFTRILYAVLVVYIMYNIDNIDYRYLMR
jgi:hypothetical protein